MIVSLIYLFVRILLLQIGLFRADRSISGSRLNHLYARHLGTTYPSRCPSTPALVNPRLQQFKSPFRPYLPMHSTTTITDVPYLRRLARLPCAVTLRDFTIIPLGPAEEDTPDLQDILEIESRPPPNINFDCILSLEPFDVPQLPCPWAIYTMQYRNLKITQNRILGYPTANLQTAQLLVIHHIESQKVDQAFVRDTIHKHSNATICRWLAASQADRAEIRNCWMAGASWCDPKQEKVAEHFLAALSES
jgi:hypothetical protein